MTLNDKMRQANDRIDEITTALEQLRSRLTQYQEKDTRITWAEIGDLCHISSELHQLVGFWGRKGV